jgi:DNA-directed RNA polymerase subunit M/transcription elongation factor TFIIS
MKKETCRHCGTTFIPRPGKPGLIDECEPCLYAKTAPKQHVINYNLQKGKNRLKRRKIDTLKKLSDDFEKQSKELARIIRRFEKKPTMH